MECLFKNDEVLSLLAGLLREHVIRCCCSCSENFC